MSALTPIMHSKQTPRARSETEVQSRDGESPSSSARRGVLLAMQIACTAEGTGESGASASLATKDAVAPRAPLRMARLLMAISWCRSNPLWYLSLELSLYRTIR